MFVILSGAKRHEESYEKAWRLFVEVHSYIYLEDKHDFIY